MSAQEGTPGARAHTALAEKTQLPHGARTEARGSGGTSQRSEPCQPERRRFVRHLCSHTQAIGGGWTSTASNQS